MYINDVNIINVVNQNNEFGGNIVFLKISYKKQNSNDIYEKEISLKNNVFQSSDFVINTKKTKEKEELLMELKVIEPMEIIDLSLKLENFFSINDKVFINGYQSWTDSYEVSVNHKDPHCQVKCNISPQ